MNSKAPLTVALIYKCTALFGVLGFVLFFWRTGFGAAAAFAGAAAFSFLNLWMLNRITLLITPGPNVRKPLQAGAFFIRFVFLLAIGYGIFVGLNVDPMAVVSGLLCGTAATLTAVIFELASATFSSRASKLNDT